MFNISTKLKYWWEKQRLKDPNFWRSQISYLESEKVKQIISIIETLNEYYGEDRWDIHPYKVEYNRELQIPERDSILEERHMNFNTQRHLLEWTSTFSYSGLDLKINEVRITIYYPEIIVRNSENDEYPIKEVYASFHVTLSSLYRITINPAFYFTRASLTLAEWSWYRGHPHASSFTIYTGSNRISQPSMCTGTGSILRTLQLLNQHSSGFDKLRFKAFLLEFNRYLGWESLEGTPYVNCSQLRRPSYANRNHISTRVIEVEANRLESIMLNNPDIIKVRLSPCTTHLKIHWDRELEDYLCSNVSNALYKVIIVNGNITYDLNNTEVDLTEYNPNLYVITFNKDVKYLRLSNLHPSEQSRVENQQFSLHPKIKEKLIQNLEEIIYEKYRIETYRKEAKSVGLLK